MIRVDQWTRAGSTPRQVVLRAQLVRGAALGQSDKATAGTLGIRRGTAALWRQRVREQGISCVWEIPSVNHASACSCETPVAVSHLPCIEPSMARAANRPVNSTISSMKARASRRTAISGEASGC